MVDPWLADLFANAERRPDISFDPATLAELRALASGDLTAAEAGARARRLTGSRGWADLIAVIEGLATDHDDEADETRLAEVLPPISLDRLPRLESVLDELRTQALTSAATALREVFSESRPGIIALAVDSGSLRDRRSAFTFLTGSLSPTAAGDMITIDPLAQDPALPSLDENSTRPVAILDGDVAPRLVDQLRARSRPGALVVIPERSLRVIGNLLEPDLLVSIPLGQVPTPSREVIGVEQLEVALDLVPNGRPRLEPLPSGRELVRLLGDFITGPMTVGPDGAARVIRVCRRLSVDGHLSAVRDALRFHHGAIDDRFQPEEAHHALAWSALYRDVGLPEQALDVLRNVPGRLGHDLRVQHAQAVALLQTNRGEEAIRLLQGLVERTRPTDASTISAAYVSHTLARAYRQTGRLGDAQRTIAHALEDAPDNLYLLIEAGIIAALAGQPVTADRHFQHAYLAAPGCGAVLNAWGRATALAGNAARAERRLERAAWIEPWNPRHELELAHLAKARGLLHEAEARLRPLLSARDPITWRRVRLELADTLIEAGETRWPEADALLTELDAQESDDRARLVSIRVKLLSAQGQYRAAGQLAQTVDGPPNRYLIAQVAGMLLDQHERRLLSPINLQIKRLAELPDLAADPVTRRIIAALRARAFELQGDIAAARQALRTALDAAPDQPMVLNTLAAVEARSAATLTADQPERQAALARAEALARGALAIDPGNAYTNRLLAQILRATQPEEAARYERYARFAGLPAQPIGDPIGAALLAAL